MRIRWERASSDPASVTYFVDDEPTGRGDAGFDQVLERVTAAAPGEPVTIRLGGLSTGGEDLKESLPFAARVDELERRAGPGRLRYELF